MGNIKDRFIFLEHTADIKFQAYGETLNGCFENCILAMINSQYEGKIKGKTKKRIKILGKDLENLLYNLLEEILFLAEKGFLTARAKIKINEEEKEKILEAELTGDNIQNYKLSWDIKAVTYSEMFVKRIGSRWVAQAVIDV